MFSDADLKQRLDDLLPKYKVPGATVAVLANDKVSRAASGVLNVATGVEATPDSIFQPGSIGKMYTATVIMKFVDEGKLSLDQPVVEVLPEFSVADPDVSKKVTLSHLLSHTSGIDGDWFIDTGRGDDCLEKYIETLPDVQQNHPLGETMSYCNSGFIVLGRIIEKLTGQVFEQAMKEQLFDPLELTSTVMLPEDALRFSAAMGHVSEGDEDPKPAPVWTLWRFATPAGGSLCATAAEVLELGRLHLNGGVASDGTRILSEKTVAAMQKPQVAIPDRWTLGTHWGLGWILFEWNGRKLYGHDGNTIGQAGFMRIEPESKVVVTLMANGGKTHALYEELYSDIFKDLAGITVPPQPKIPETPVEIDLEKFAGVYERAAVRTEITVGDGVLKTVSTLTGPLAQTLGEDEPQESTMTPVDAGEQLFVDVSDKATDESDGTPAVFFTLPNGQEYVHSGARANPKIS